MEGGSEHVDAISALALRAAPRWFYTKTQAEWMKHRVYAMLAKTELQTGKIIFILTRIRNVVQAGRSQSSLPSDGPTFRVAARRSRRTHGSLGW